MPPLTTARPCSFGPVARFPDSKHLVRLVVAGIGKANWPYALLVADRVGEKLG